MYANEELIWQKRSGEQWVLKGDANTGYFHSIANGRKRRCRIEALEDGDRTITDQRELQLHIEQYYKNLFGNEVRNEIELHPNIWQNTGHLKTEESEALIAPFTIEEIEITLKEMKNNTAPGPDGLSVEFYKAFWPEIKGLVLEMFNKLHAGQLNLSRLNYGLISLIPKTKEANTIKQYRPICLLEVDYKLFTKVLATRLTIVDESTISKNQTAFIPGRNILDGIVILHETLHELRVRKQKGVIMKLDFEKAYDKVQWSFLMEVMQKKGFPAYG